MISVITTADQTVQPGQAIIFQSINWISGNKCNPPAESFRPNSTNVRTAIGVYEVSFTGNIGGVVAATPVQLEIELDGSPLSGTLMMSTPAAVTDFNNVGADTFFGNSPLIGGSSISVVNTGTSVLTVRAGAALKVARRGGR